jgi:hypothetical protein
LWVEGRGGLDEERLRSFSQIKAFDKRENSHGWTTRFVFKEGEEISTFSKAMNVKLKVAVCQRSFLNKIKKFICTQGRRINLQPKAGIVKNYCATNSGSPEVLSMDHIVQILNWAAY